jgi:hypothetical protein
MHAQPQVSLHEIGPPLSSSGGGRIHRQSRVNVPCGFAPIGFSSTRLCRVEGPSTAGNESLFT